MQRALIAIKNFHFSNIAYLYIYANNKSSYTFTVETREMQNAELRIEDYFQRNPIKRPTGANPILSYSIL